MGVVFVLYVFGQMLRPSSTASSRLLCTRGFGGVVELDSHGSKEPVLVDPLLLTAASAGGLYSVIDAEIVFLLLQPRSCGHECSSNDRNPMAPLFMCLPFPGPWSSNYRPIMQHKPT